MYLVNTRPDICYVVNAHSEFMSEPREIHLVVVKHILRYFCGTVGHGLRYVARTEMRLEVYFDSDWDGSTVDRKRTWEYYG